MPTKPIPLRKCLGCGEMKPKKTLVRVVHGTDGSVAIDRTGKMPGRGAYVCPCAACLAAAQKARRLERAFSTKIPDEVYAALQEALTTDGE